MNYYSTQITNLIDELRRLPGIGSKSAQRLAFHIINMPEEHVHHLAQTLVTAREKIRYCKYCCTLTDSEVCPICASTKRDHSTIMVVEHTQDLAAYEKTGQYHGVYHVLQGTLAPSLGKGPDDIRFKELEERLKNPEVKELILATNSSLDGEATAMYITKKVKPLGIKVTRIASGVPIGGELEYIDEVTLSRALDGRVELGKRNFRGKRGFQEGDEHVGKGTKHTATISDGAEGRKACDWAFGWSGFCCTAPRSAQPAKGICMGFHHRGTYPPRSARSSGRRGRSFCGGLLRRFGDSLYRKAL